MRQHGIQSKMSNKFAITTDSTNTLQTAPDRLARQFSVDAPGMPGCDTTFIPIRQCWLYLAVVVEV
jgi:putative transposase